MAFRGGGIDPGKRHTNKFKGAYVTAGARLYLYTYLDRLQERAIYCDTDSVVYFQPRERPALVKTGDNLGPRLRILNPPNICSNSLVEDLKTMPTRQFMRRHGVKDSL